MSKVYKVCLSGSPFYSPEHKLLQNRTRVKNYIKKYSGNTTIIFLNKVTFQTEFIIYPDHSFPSKSAVEFIPIPCIAFSKFIQILKTSKLHII